MTKGKKTHAEERARRRELRLVPHPIPPCQNPQMRDRDEQDENGAVQNGKAPPGQLLHARRAMFTRKEDLALRFLFRLL